jgi:hypothetical protein
MALPFKSTSSDSNNDSRGSPVSDFHIVTAQDVNSPTLGSHLETPELGLPNPDSDTDSRTELCGSILEEFYKAKMGKPSKDDARKKAQSLSLIEQVRLRLLDAHDRQLTTSRSRSYVVVTIGEL